MKYVNKRPKTSKIKRTNKKEFGHGSARSISYWRYPRRAKSWCFCAVLTKESALDAMRIGTHSFPSSREQTKIIYLQNVHFCFFENTFVNSGLKKDYIFRNCVEIEFYLCDFSFFIMSSSGGKLDLKLTKICLQSRFSGPSYLQI